MKEFVIGVLSDPNVTAAIAGILSAALLAFGTWVKNKVSSTALINEWWEYIHPLRDALISVVALDFVRPGAYPLS